MTKQLVYGFLDESSSLHDKAFFFCVDIISTSEKTNKQLQNILRKARRKIVKKKLKSLTELKFYNSDEKTRVFVLTELAKQDVSIFALTVDKEGRRVDDTPENYGMVVGATIAELLEKFPSLSLTVDKKYTSLKQQDEFLQTSQETINKIGPKGSFVSFNPPADSRRDSLVQLADFVAGAMNFKYNQQDSHYAEIIEKKTVVDKVEKWTELKKRIVKP